MGIHFIQVKNGTFSEDKLLESIEVTLAGDGFYTKISLNEEETRKLQSYLKDDGIAKFELMKRLKIEKENAIYQSTNTI